MTKNNNRPQWKPQKKSFNFYIVQLAKYMRLSLFQVIGRILQLPSTTHLYTRRYLTPTISMFQNHKLNWAIIFLPVSKKEFTTMLGSILSNGIFCRALHMVMRVSLSKYNEHWLFSSCIWKIKFYLSKESCVYTFSNFEYLINISARAQHFMVVLNKHKFNLDCYELRQWKTKWRYK